ncbi:MAG: hypothetical protein V7765_19945 [Oleispira sp.]
MNDRQQSWLDAQKPRAHYIGVKSKGEIMAEPHWTSYIGMISGLVGVLVASFSLYKSSKIKTLDLRLELKRAVLDINSLHENLGELLLRAKKSRESMAAAMGDFKSGGMKLWGDENSKDENSLQEMKLKLPSKENTYKSKNSEELEAMLVEIHAQKNTLLSIKDKYIESMEKDVKDGGFLREQAHKRV